MRHAYGQGLREPRPDRPPMTVLVVDDRPALGKLVRSFLGREDTCLHARTLESASLLLEAVQVNVLAVSSASTKKRGAAWLAELVEEHPALASRTIVVTEPPSGEASMLTPVSLGIGTLAQPVPVEQLEREIEERLARPPTRVPGKLRGSVPR